MGIYKGACMQLTNCHVTNYKNIDDSTAFSVDPKVTCLVGKNEAGKTAILQALYRLNPIEDCSYDAVQDYPRRKMRSYLRGVESGGISPAKVLKSIFKLGKEDVSAVTDDHGSCLSVGDEVSITVGYDGRKWIGLNVNEKAWLDSYIDRHDDFDGKKTVLKKSKNVKELIESIRGLDGEVDFSEHVTALQKIAERGVSLYVWETVLTNRVPKIFFFDDYRIMRGEARLNEIESSSDDGLKTLNELLQLAGVTPAELQNDDDYEHHKANLESIANEITDEVFKYWKQNTNLEVELDVHRAHPSDHAGVFHVRIKNNRHRVTVPFDERSRGFVWFFSFLTAFKKLSMDHSRLVILLDEPGLNLHASAQNDLLRFIEEVLSVKHQVVYTTHSPFMIDPQRLERVRTVEDFDEVGVKVSSDCLSVDKNTVFPLQAAMGYSLAQTLFLGPNCLLVEGPSDLIYLQAVSELLEKDGRTGLDERWVITPVGGADKLATFATLIGSNELNVCVLMDISKKDRQRVENLVKNEYLNSKNIITLNQFVDADEADVEDIFEPKEYLKFVKKAYPDEFKGVSANNLENHPRILVRIDNYLKKKGSELKFNHFKPAQEALFEIGKSKKLEESTLDRFGKIFETVNNLLPK